MAANCFFPDFDLSEQSFVFYNEPLIIIITDVSDCRKPYRQGMGVRGRAGCCRPSETSEDRIIRFNLVSEYHNIVIKTCCSTLA